MCIYKRNFQDVNACACWITVKVPGLTPTELFSVSPWVADRGALLGWKRICAGLLTVCFYPINRFSPTTFVCLS